MTHPKSCNWCLEAISGGAERHGICKVAAAAGNVASLALLHAVELDSCHEAMRTYQHATRFERARRRT